MGEPGMRAIEHRTIEIFCAVAESGSATMAADYLGVTQPAVTKAIAEFERRCGFALFQRGHFGMRLTADGKLLYDAAARSFAGLEHIEQSIRALRAGARGELRIAAIPVLAEGLVAWALGRFARQNPDVGVSLGTDWPHEILRSVALGEADLGVLFGPIARRPNLSAVTIGSSELMVLLPSGHRLAQLDRVAFSDLDGETLVLLSAPHPIRTIVEARMFEGGSEARSSREAATQRAVAIMIAAGAGIGFIDSEMARQLPASGLVAIPVYPRAGWSIHAVYDGSGQTLASAARAFVKLLESGDGEVRAAAGPPLKVEARKSARGAKRR